MRSPIGAHFPAQSCNKSRERESVNDTCSYRLQRRQFHSLPTSLARSSGVLKIRHRETTASGASSSCATEPSEATAGYNNSGKHRWESRLPYFVPSRLTSLQHEGQDFRAIHARSLNLAYVIIFAPSMARCWVYDTNLTPSLMHGRASRSYRM